MDHDWNVDPSSKRLSRELLAKDVYSVWRKRVREADFSVTIFTPYLDRLVVSLMKQSQAIINTVVTDLSPQSGALDYLAQLRAIKRLLEMKVEVRSLDRLHAKVLLTDDRTITVGSQNFTSYARRSREVTTAISDSVLDTPAVKTLDEWLEQSEIVTLDLIEQLLDGAKQETKQLKLAHQSLINKVRELRSDYEFEVFLKERNQWAKLQRESRYRLQQDNTTASLRTVARQDSWTSYSSLIVSGAADLTTWLVERDGQIIKRGLERLDMRPMILTDSGQMAFGRIAKTRISYVRTSVRWGSSITLRGKLVDLSVTFPRDELDIRNVSLQLASRACRGLSATVHLLFNGGGVRAASWEVAEGGYSAALVDEFRAACEELFATDEAMRESFKRFVGKGFRYKELRRDDINADDYFENVWYRVGLVEFADSPILTFTRLDS